MNLSTSSFKTKQYLGYALLLAVFFLLFDRMLYLGITLTEEGILRDDSFEKEFAEFVAGKNYNTLILGTSRTAEAIHPYYFEKHLNQRAFKEAQYGKGPKYNYLFYQFFKKHAGKPRVVIYGMDFFTFGIQSRKRWLYRLGELQKHQQAGLLDAPSLLASHRAEITDFVNFIIESTAEWLGMVAADHAIMGLEELQYYRGSEWPNTHLVTRKPARFKRHSFHPYPGEEGNYFSRLLQQCHEDGVTVILVLIPDHIGTFRTYVGRFAFLSLLQELAEPYPQAHVLNYNHLRKFPLENNDYFIDGGYGKANSHLSRTGARVFNKQLTSDLSRFYRP